MINSHSGKENKAIVTDVGFGKDKISVVLLDSEDTKITEVEEDQVTPIFNAQLDLPIPSVGSNIEI